MAKFGVGVGEDFPVNEPDPGTPTPPHPKDVERRRRHRRWHHVFHVLLRVALILLVISAIAWLFRPAYFYPLPYPYAPYAPYLYPHHFFFPFFPILLITLLIAFAWRRGACYGMHHRHWHGPELPQDKNGEGR